MGGNNDRAKKSSGGFGVFNIFKAKRASRKWEQDTWDDGVKAYRVFPSDEDGRRWVAKPGIDKDTSAYIAKVHAATQHAEFDRHAIAVSN